MFSTFFFKSYKDLRSKTKILMFINVIRTSNGSDHELEAHESVQSDL